MSKISVVVELDVAEKDFDSLYEKLCLHARTSRAEDKGCQRFDVSAPLKGKNKLFLYEVWASREDLETHSNSEHTAQHRKRTEGLSTGRKLTLCRLSEGGQP
ncbi:MAG: antibiotic biosynthesis monooxygenase [Candidatus Lambdaproteobacteria bacterium]|nr:antibiotic biosynthesis monooxygenase [Candidatus Lambdaproteobacteria bacterium]